jgi:hypothetical protein
MVTELKKISISPSFKFSVIMSELPNIVCPLYGIIEIPGVKTIPVDAKFNKIIYDFLKSFVEKGVMPPAEVAPAILNMADDLVNHRPLIMRSGDYHLIGNYIRNMDK